MSQAFEPRAETVLRQVQQRLDERLRDAAVLGASQTRLGLAIGEARWLVDLSESGGILALPASITPVPHTWPWLRGLVNLRGTILSVCDLSSFAGGEPTPLGKDARVLAFASSLKFNAAILVTRMLGLHALSAMTPLEAAADLPATPLENPEPAWKGPVWVDAQARRWCELRLALLAADPRFTQAERPLGQV
jgi:twitching motility protein PilI